MLLKNSLNIKILKALSFVFITTLAFQIFGQNNAGFIDSIENEILKADDVQQQIEGHMQLCWVLRNRDPEKAIFHGNSAIALIDKSKLEENYAKALNYLGVCHRNKGEYNYALDLYNQALSWAFKTKNTIQIAYSYNNIGGIYTLTNSYPEAVEAIEKAIQLFEENKDLAGEGYAAVNLGNLYRHLKSYDKSLEFLDRARKIKTMLNDSIGLTTVKQLRADVLKKQGKIVEASRLLDELKIEYTHNNDTKGLAVVINELGLIELESGNYNSAIQLFEEAEATNLKIKNNQGLAYNSLNLGLAYHKIGKSQMALKKVQDGLEKGSLMGDKQILLKAYTIFSQIHSETNNWQSAYKAKTEYIKIYSELYSFEQSEQINSIRNKYENEKKIIEQQLLEEKNATIEQKFTFSKTKYNLIKLSGILSILFAISLIVFFWFHKKKSKESEANTILLNKQNLALQEANTTKEKFLSIIGHDLKNPFNSVLGLSNLIIDQWESLDDSERFQITNEINSSSHSIYELLDNLLIWSRTQTSSTKLIPESFDINETIGQISDIFRNQATYKQINVRLEISGIKKVYADPNMIATVIRNLFSNALKFTNENGQIEIRTVQKADIVEFSITDNGKGILPEDLKKIFEDKGHKTTKGTANETGSGLGLLLSKDFIQRNNGLIWVESKPGKGSSFIFTLPIDKPKS
jgi:signal transduction histidine kinase/Flp pilus assembly protein TadD